MAQNYTQTRYIRTACTQVAVARRNAGAILAIARIAAAILGSPAPLSNVEKRKGSRRVVRRNGSVCVHMSWRGRPRSRRSRSVRKFCGRPWTRRDRGPVRRSPRLCRSIFVSL